MTPDQQAFEDRCWEHYLAERARRTMPGDVEGAPTREGLFWRREDGSYGVLAFNTAWMAYQWGMQEARGQGVPEHCDSSCTSYKLAEMVMSDCGHSTNNERLLDRIAARIDKHVDAILAELMGATTNGVKQEAGHGR